ncbi:GT2 family glycosyltransferase [Diaminobutyricimonas aerilata]|uniref:GT2 family glycosyltransferase n=1 Tax=Diaminobutyricimonas aerilata TaxID=1162967 RepID=A0A2M9CH55_9MICO|nr:glycosyltransferase family 2 protein [Diaminobutyricimonas aerilata]PJJ71244.1 GT2 family glycosyltransferase [Diaminobutyricimonas aerilata]
MQPRVTAILVARNGDEYLDRTLAAIRAQTRRPDRLVGVEAGGSDATLRRLESTDAVVSVGRKPVGEAISLALRSDDARGDDEWLWLLTHDNAPTPTTLAALLGTVEVSPSVAVAGPKVMRADDPDIIARYGEAVTTYGASLTLVENELDQGQHDRLSDVLAVAADGMLVRRSVWDALGGFDPGLPAVDAALDFCIRARLAGHRVVGVPGARVQSAGGPELFGRTSVSPSTHDRLVRTAHLHRRLVYAPVWALPLLWLALVPLAVVRSLGLLLAKRPGSVPGELGSAFAVAFGGTGVLAARRTLRRGRRMGWGAIAPLRIPAAEAREIRAARRDASRARGENEVSLTPRPEFFSSGGAWIVLLALLIGVIVFSPLLGAEAVAGGALLPLADSVGQLWSNIGVGWRDLGLGFEGAADPFATVLAVLGTLSPWQPSTVVVVLYFVSLGLAALGAWFAAARFSRRGWGPAVAALLWAFAPPLLASLESGHLGAVIAHLLLPWLVLLVVDGARSWASAAGAGLVFALVVVSAPVLTPALLIAWIAWLVARPRAIHRLIALPLPALALAAPLVLDQLARGTPLALLADPGRPFAEPVPPAWQLALGAPELGLHGWTRVLGALGLPDGAAAVLVAALLLALAALALLGVFLPGTSRSIPALALAALGFVTAVASTRLELAHYADHPVTVWAGSGVSLYWLGLVGAAVFAIGALGRSVAGPALVTALLTPLVAIPLLAALLTGVATVHADEGSTLPAFVIAEAEADPGVGTLVLTAESPEAISAVVQRGQGETLDDQSTLAATSTRASDDERELARLAGNLVSEAEFDASTDFATWGLDFVLLETDGDPRRTQSMEEALDANPQFTPVGQTTGGLLWRFADDTGLPDRGPGNTDTAYGVTVLVVQGVIIGATLLLAVPTQRRRRVRRSEGTIDDPATTFDEDDGA